MYRSFTTDKPHYRHVLNIADAAIVCEQPHKTLKTLYELLVDAPHPPNAADCLRISLWEAVDLREPLQENSRSTSIFTPKTGPLF